MSAVVAQSSPPRPVADQGPAPGAVNANSPAPWGKLGSPRLTEAVLAAADDVRSSAEKLPVSHRLPVSRSVFDSDEGNICNGPCCHLPPPVSTPWVLCALLRIIRQHCMALQYHAQCSLPHVFQNMRRCGHCQCVRLCLCWAVLFFHQPAFVY